MKKVLETEVLGTLTKDAFESIKQRLERAVFDDKKTMRRLSIQLTDYSRQDLDTRIRITNGDAEIMQKIGDWNAETREELSVQLPLSADAIFKHFLVLDNILHAETVQKNIIQMESHVFITSQYEIKLTHQYGSHDAYNFEVEVYNSSIDPLEVCRLYELSPDTMPKDAAYWDVFNKRVNLEIRNLSKKQILAIIRQHC